MIDPAFTERLEQALSAQRKRAVVMLAAATAAVAVAYDEASHAMLFTRHSRRTLKSGEEHVDVKQVTVKLEPSVGDAEAYAFARELDSKTGV